MLVVERCTQTQIIVKKGEEDKMADYQIVKKCGLCREQMVLKKEEKGKRFCDKCQVRIDKSKD